VRLDVLSRAVMSQSPRTGAILRENLTQRHRRRYYQLLVNENGMLHWKVSAGYGVFQLTVGISVLKARRANPDE
jgi:hypothetical protein